MLGGRVPQNGFVSLLGPPNGGFPCGCRFVKSLQMEWPCKRQAPKNTNTYAQTTDPPQTANMGTHQLGPPVVPFYLVVFFWGGSPTKIDYRKKGALILSTGGPSQNLQKWCTLQNSHTQQKRGTLKNNSRQTPQNGIPSREPRHAKQHKHWGKLKNHTHQNPHTPQMPQRNADRTTQISGALKNDPPKSHKKWVPSKTTHSKQQKT